MIYPIRAKSALPELEDYKAPRVELRSQITGCISQLPFALIVVPFVLLVILLVFILFVLANLIFNIVDFLLGNKDEDEKDEEVEEDDQADMSEESLIESTYDESKGWLQLRFNHIGLKEFVEALAGVYMERKAPMMIDSTGIARVKSENFHAHSEDFFPAIDQDMIVSTGDGLFHLDSGLHICASPEIWQKAIIEWRRVLLRKAPALIVLDKYQTEWCLPECQGRLSMEYLPNECQQLPPA